MPLDTNDFVDGLISRGYTHLCVVPCSFAKNLINAVINNNDIEYTPCASEAVACSVAAGLKMSGKFPVVIVQSSGLTNMGSCITSLLKPYDITFPILSSWRTYKEGDSEIQHKHLATGLPSLANAYGYEYIILNTDSVNQALKQVDLCDQSATLCIIKKGSFSEVTLDDKHKIDLTGYSRRSEYLICLNSLFNGKDALFIGTTGNTAREMYTYMKDTNNFYMAGNMGGALSLGLGASLAGKKKVIICGGDAEFVMHMGGLTTAGRYKNKINLTYILFDNESNKSTGGQNTYQQHVDYIHIAKSAGFEVEDSLVSNVDMLSKIMKEGRDGLNFICVKCGLDEVTPRPPLNVVKVSQFK